MRMKHAEVGVTLISIVKENHQAKAGAKVKRKNLLYNLFKLIRLIHVPPPSYLLLSEATKNISCYPAPCHPL